MFKSKLYTNFVAAHVVWFQTIMVLDLITSVGAYFVEGCFFLWVRTTQASKIISCTSGLTVFCARFIDADFRETLKLLGNFHKSDIQAIKDYSVITELTNELGSTEGSIRSFAVFRSLQIKVRYSQFIIDTLISLSYTFTRQDVAKTLR